MLRLLVFVVLAVTWTTACGDNSADSDRPASEQSTPGPESTLPGDNPSLEDEIQYSIDMLDLVRDMTAMNEGVADQYRSYLSCASDVSCLNATEALMDAFRQSRPALVDLEERAEALSERSNSTYDEFAVSLLSMFRLRLEGQDDLVEGWETGNEAQFIAGAEKFDEAGLAYLEALGNFPLEE